MSNAHGVNDRNYMVTNNNAVDVHVGRQIRLRRTMVGMSQEQLGINLDITFQQVQKYERGTNRVSASRLWDISQILDVEIGYFFENMSHETKSKSPRRVSTGNSRDTVGTGADDPMAKRETLELVKAYYSIEQKPFRRQITAMVKSFATMINSREKTPLEE